jgi:hypothetical protein
LLAGPLPSSLLEGALVCGRCQQRDGLAIRGFFLTIFFAHTGLKNSKTLELDGEEQQIDVLQLCLPRIMVQRKEKKERKKKKTAH